MKTLKGTYEDIADKVAGWQTVETQNIDYTDREIPKTKNALIRVMLQALRLEAEKRRLIQQMILDSVQKESVNLSPDELRELSAHLNRYMESEEEAVSLGKEAFAKNELAIPHFLLSYLIEDLKRHNGLLRQFDDKLKNASIPTSASAGRVGSSRAA